MTLSSLFSCSGRNPLLSGGKYWKQQGNFHQIQQECKLGYKAHSLPSIVGIFKILIIHSSIDRHLNCFYLLVIMSNDAISIYVQMFMWLYIYIYTHISLEFELLSHMVSLFLVVWGTVRLFSKAVLPFYILTSSKLVL